MILKGERQLRARLNAIGKTDGLMREIVLHGVREAKILVPRRTGNLGRTIRVGTVTRDHGEIRAGGVAKVGYAAAVELRTRPHIIRPRKAKMLAWGGSRTLGGRVRSGSRPTNFARLVRHPGTRAKPFLRPGLLKAATTKGLGSLVRLWNEAA